MARKFSFRLARDCNPDRFCHPDAHLFTQHWRLDQAEEAYRLFDRQTSGKGVFVMA
jgi:hypothetical protein